MKIRILKIISFCLVGLAIGCGNKVSYRVTPSDDLQSAPGTYMIPPKVDVVIFQDNSGSISFFGREASVRIRNFLDQLKIQGWDYRFAMVSLLDMSKPVKQVAASDFNLHSPSYRAPYPGAPKSEDYPLAEGFFRSPENFSDFSNPVSSFHNGKEPGLQNILDTFANGFNGSGFLRADAMTVVVVIGNGNDTSWVNYGERVGSRVVGCQRADHTPSSCEGADWRDTRDSRQAVECLPTATDPTGGVFNCRSGRTSFDYYREKLKGLNSRVRLYSIVAPTDTWQDYRGTRYINMASALGGRSFNIRNSSDEVLKNLAQDLNSVKKSYITQYLFTAIEPNPDTIQVKKYLSGNSQQVVEIPRSETNGWSYAGYVSNVGVTYAIGPNGDRIYIAQGSGYAILLNGSAQLSGGDTALVDSKPAGARNAVSQ